MSRIGNKPISIQEGIDIQVSSDNVVTVKGPKGELTQKIDPDIVIEINDTTLQVKRPSEQKRYKAMHGLYRSLIANMIEGVSQGYKKELELIGVGYRATVQNNVLDLSLGHSHHVFFQVPEEVKVIAESQKGKSPRIILESIDKQLIGHVAAKIKALRKVEPYKGKGIRFVGEFVRRKAGKTAAK